jgi:hypothetical protein
LFCASLLRYASLISTVVRQPTEELEMQELKKRERKRKRRRRRVQKHPRAHDMPTPRTDQSPDGYARSGKAASDQRWGKDESDSGLRKYVSFLDVFTGLSKSPSVHGCKTFYRPLLGPRARSTR